MRCIPTALAVTDREQRIRESMQISAITHDDPWCTTSCAAYNEVAAALLDSATPAEAVTAGHAAAAELGQPDVAEAIAYGRRLPLAEAAATGHTLLRGAAAGLVLDSLSLAVAAVLDPRDLADVLIDIVRIGHDTDTNAAIAGGLLGARDGATTIPRRWTTTLQYATEFTAAAHTLTTTQPAASGDPGRVAGGCAGGGVGVGDDGDGFDAGDQARPGADDDAVGVQRPHRPAG
jgi:ADP-ribosylglycohydrolase